MDSDQKIILVVDDDKATSDALKKKLEKEGFLIDLAENGVKCIESVAKRKPDLILLDMIMPVMSGTETLEHLKKDENTKDIPIVVLTNIDSEKQVAQILENDVQDYLIKTDQTLENIVAYVKAKLD